MRKVGYFVMRMIGYFGMRLSGNINADTQLDWQKRMKIKKRSAISKFLQRLVATSKEKIQRYGLENLRRQACYDSPMRKFKEALLEAIDELIRVGVLASGWIEISTRRQEQITLTKFVRE